MTRKMKDNLVLGLIYLAAFFSVILLLVIILYVFIKGLPSINWGFLTTVTSALKGTTGIAGNIVNTLYIVVLTLLFATPIGIGSAIYLNEYAKPGKFVEMGGNLTNNHETKNFFVKKCKSFCNFL